MEIYHIINRGVDKRKIFLEKKDYIRFIHDLFEFNDEENVLDVGYYFNKNSPQSLDIGYPEINKRRRKLIINILAFSLMPNHYHLLLQPITENGVSFFMQKLNGGYSRYFNRRHQRTGALFQGKYKAVLIKREAHFIHIPYYIHCNPLDLIVPDWREQRIRNSKAAFHFLEQYRWSSFPDYIGKKNFPSVTNRDFLLSFYEGPTAYKTQIKHWLKNLQSDQFKELEFEG